MAERPLECAGECRRPISVHYKEMVGGATSEFIACAQCPVWQRKLHGQMQPGELSSAREAGLCCGNCGTTLEAVQVGHTLGCPTCYEVFADTLMHDLITSHAVSKRITAKGKKSVPIHIGRIPGEQAAISPIARLTALNEALNETLAHEDYEQAALLRDQIRQITGPIEPISPAPTVDPKVKRPKNGKNKNG